MADDVAVYPKLGDRQKNTVDDLTGVYRPLSWRQRHELFVSYAERAVSRLLEEHDRETAEKIAKLVLATTAAATLERLGVTECDDAWCAVQLLCSVRDNHREMGERWREDNPLEWAVVEREVTNPPTH